MKKLTLLVVFGLLFTVGLNVSPKVAHSQSASKGQIMFILDASSSMLAKDGTGTTRFDKAKSALSKALDSIPSDTEVGLRVYGSTVPDTNKSAGCQDTQLVAAPAANNATKVKSAVTNIQAKGWTLMGKSLQEVQKDFTGDSPKTVILLSDGIDTCSPPSACEVAKNLSLNGVKIKVDTLGLLVDGNAKAQLGCIASGSGGDYFDINNIDKLQSTLETITKKEVDLFNTKGIPIKGTLRIEDAPKLQADTLYTDNLIIPQELYYVFDAKPGQKIIVTVKAVGRGLPLTSTDYLNIDGFHAKTSKKLVYDAGNVSKFGTSDVTTIVYEIDNKKDITQPESIAAKVSIDLAYGSKADGSTVPLEISYSVEGASSTGSGSQSSTNNSGTASKKSASPIIIVLLTLLGVILLAAISFIVYKALKKRRNSQNLNSQPATTMPTTPTNLTTPDKPDVTDQTPGITNQTINC